MKKLEYLSALENVLKRSMPQKEVNDIVRDYAEYFEEGKSQNKSDSEISAKLGDPELVARQILEENGYKQPEISYAPPMQRPPKQSDGEFWTGLKKGLSLTAKIILVLFLFPFAIVALATVAGFVIGFAGLIFSAAVICALAAVFGLAACGVVFAAGLPVVGILGVIISIGSLAFAIMLTSLMIMIFPCIYRIFIRILRDIVDIFRVKSVPQQTIPQQPIIQDNAPTKEEETNENA